MSMRKVLLAALAVPTLMVSLKAPAQAAEYKTIFDVPLKLTLDTAALGTGLTVGIPISIIQSVPKSVDDLAQKIQADMSDDRSLTSYVAASVPAIPAGTVYGVLLGVQNGSNNAFANYHEHPFSDASLSLE